MRRRQFGEMMDEFRTERRLHREELRRNREESQARHVEAMASIAAFREEVRAHREQAREELRALREEQARRFDAIGAAIENDRRVTREILLELRAGRELLRDLRHGIQANTEGLLRVLDELRRGNGPSAASA